MTTASIRINGVATPNEVLKIGDVVTLTNNDNTGVLTWAWEILSKPTGSTAALSSPSASAPTFTVDVEGAYLIRLVVNDTLPDEAQHQAIGRVKTVHIGLKPHAKDETGEGNSVEGWAKAWRESYLLLDKALGLSARRTVKYVGAPLSGPLVLTVTGVATLTNGDVVPTVDALNAGNASSAVVLWDGGALATNDVVSALVHGISKTVTNPDTFTAGAPAYLGTAGALTKTIPAANNAHLLGFALTGGASIVLWFDPAVRFNNATLPTTIGPAAAISGTSPNAAHADHTHQVTYPMAIAAPLPVVPTTAVLGVATLPAREDHVHALNGALQAAYLKTVSSPPVNVVNNGGFRWWERGVLTSSLSFNGVGYSGRQYLADRWYSTVFDSNGVDTINYTFSRVASGLPTSEFALRIRNGTAPTVGGYALNLVQEIDREVVKQLRGKNLSWSLKVRKGSSVAGGLIGLTVEVISNTGAESQALPTYSGGAVVGTAAADNDDIGTSFTTFAGTTLGVVPASANGLSIRVSMNCEFAYSAGDANDYIDVAEVIVCEERDTLPIFRPAGGSTIADLNLCKRFYEKSYPQDVAPGTTLAVGFIPNGPFENIAYAASAPINIERQKFLVEKRVAPTVTLYRRSGTVGEWQFQQSPQTVLSDFATTLGFNVRANAGFSASPGIGPLVYTGHWTADSEI